MVEASPLRLRLTGECLWANIGAPGLESAVAMEDRNQVLGVSAGYSQKDARAFVEEPKPHHTNGA